jgi:hypothetical protein
MRRLLAITNLELFLSESWQENLADLIFRKLVAWILFGKPFVNFRDAHLRGRCVQQARGDQVDAMSSFQWHHSGGPPGCNRFRWVGYARGRIHTSIDVWDCRQRTNIVERVGLGFFL